MTPTMPLESKQPSPADLPNDLYSLLGERALVTLTLRAVDAVAARLPRWEGDPDGEASPQMLLALLTYCYAAGTYASEDVEWACRHREGARYICGHTGPDQDFLRHFRRANRPWIEECLAWVLEQAQGQLPSSSDSRESLGAQPSDPSESPFLNQARRRVQLAALMDMALAD